MTRIPNLMYTIQGGEKKVATLNKEKSLVLADAFFPAKPDESTVSLNYNYPERIDYTCKYLYKQLGRVIK